MLLIQWHGDQTKRKLTGGKRKNYKAKRSFELGGEAILTEYGTFQKKLVKGYGNTRKIEMCTQLILQVSGQFFNGLKTVREHGRLTPQGSLAMNAAEQYMAQHA